MWGSAGRILCSVLLTEWGPEGGGSHLWPSPSIGGAYHVHMGDLGNPHPATPTSHSSLFLQSAWLLSVPLPAWLALLEIGFLLCPLISF